MTDDALRVGTLAELTALLPWLPAARDRWLPRPGHVTPLTLRAWLSAPVALPRVGAVCIEGVLQHAMVIAETGRLPGEVFAGFPRHLFANLPAPIADVEMHGRAIACASWPRSSPDAREALVMHTHKPEAEQLGLRKVYISMGETKPKRVPVPTLAVTWLEWSLLADLERLIELLPGARALAKWRGALGSVDRWEVLDASDDYSLLRDGSPARVLPVFDEAEAMERFPRGYVLDEQNTRAPYWHRATRSLVACPPSEAVC